ncbi:3-isopropylmalate dehydrogenase [Lojkania enalia]|uniref:3-isopropylmalate dehydrogenase n=1 Tax=Lojkania enalia TaxID=147567 RepID=A0A9P4MZ38_9PLEO|nr:3-isopropylmalate dehydrogenase [Didymosphaeria enalia]
MPSFNIVVFAGDGVGPEIIAEAVKVLKAVEKHSDVSFNFQPYDFGGISIDNHGNPLTEEALSAAKSADAIILGAVGGPKWGTGKVRPEQGILRLRKELGTFGNLRPCFFASDTLVNHSPLKADIVKGTNFNIIRELTGGIYFGDRKEDEGDGKALDTEPYSVEEIERIVRLAGTLASVENPPVPVWSLDKANVLATSRLWRKTFERIMKDEFPHLQSGTHLIDSAAMLMIKNPRALNGVVVTSNLFGDIISDEASVIPGSLGLLPSASLGGIPDGITKINGIYEPIHGSAPDIAGQGIVNPVATILSMSMMLKYSLCQPDLAQKIDEATKIVIDKGIRTRDIGGSSKTAEVGNAVAAELEQLLKK